MKNELRAVIALITTYTIGNFLILFNQGIYWDSWVWMPLTKAKRYEFLWNLLADDTKRFTAYYLYRISGLFDNPILFMKLLAFLSWLLAGLFLYGILRKKLSLRVDRAFFISAAVILTPTFLVRIEPSILQHSVNLMLFFMAALIYFIAEKNKNKFVAAINYGLSWLLFFLSFHTYSLLVFYGGFLLLLFVSYHQENPGRPLKALLWPWLKSNFLFIILPIIFWCLKIFFWQPEGNWAGYDNFINPVSSPSFTILLLWETIIYGFFWPILASILVLHRKIFALLFLIVSSITYLATKKIYSHENEIDSTTQKGKEFESRYYLIAGGILFSLGFLPYFLTGKVPHILGNPFNMRAALLLPLGSSLIILGTLLLIIKKGWQPLVQRIILTLFITFAIYNYYGLDMDWYKQIAVIESLKTTNNEDIKTASTLIFWDKIRGLNWLNREIHGEEYIGYLQEIYDFQKNPKIGVTEGEHIINKQDIQKIPVARSYPENFNPLEKVINVNITTYDGPEILTVSNWLKIKQLELFGGKQFFMNKINDTFRIKLEINS